jgi:hypothetical protein
MPLRTFAKAACSMARHLEKKLHHVARIHAPYCYFYVRTCHVWLNVALNAISPLATYCHEATRKYVLIYFILQNIIIW